jgi:acetyl esterase/lipase
MTLLHLIRGACAAGMLLAAAAHAQNGAAKPSLEEFIRMGEANPPRPATAPAVKPIPLSGTGSAQNEIWETMFGQLTLRNVTRPALYPVLPAPGRANGTALVIAPGGGFLSLSFDNEGMKVARHLAQQGVSCFVLAYRLDPTPVDAAGFMQAVARRFASVTPGAARSVLKDDGAQALAQQDGLAAIRHLRSRATDYGIDSHRIGMIGFSAGARTTMNVATAYDADSRPDFIGVIYGAAPDRPVPRDAPPAFIAVAADDPLSGYGSVPIFENWRAAGKSAELHVYAAGDHGFGMRRTGTSADNWILHFTQWMQASKLLPQ